MRRYDLYLQDMLQSASRIEDYTKGLSFTEFEGNHVVADAVARNLEIIGEAAKNVPEDYKNKHPEIEWRKIAGFRDVLAHEYFGIDNEIVWDIVKNKLPELQSSVKKLIKQ